MSMSKRRNLKMANNFMEIARRDIHCQIRTNTKRRAHEQ